MKLGEPNSACIFVRKQPFQNNEFNGTFIDSIDPNGVAEIGSWKMGMLFLSGTYRDSYAHRMGGGGLDGF